MSRRRAFASSISAAVIAAAITAGAFLSFGGRDSPVTGEPSGAIQYELSESLVALGSPAVPLTPPDTFSGLTRSAVDWSSVYARVSPSLVSVVTEAGTGSGFFVTEDGHVITNLHVVSDAEQVYVHLQDRSRHEAEMIARDAGNDLALLKIDADAITISVPRFGGLDDLRIGDPVGALGAPFGLPNSLTVGIVSALDRTRPSGTGTLEPLRAMIQTDAALNPGNSGGMLVDELGRVVGIPTQIESSDRSSSGIGFAVSAEALLRSLPIMLQGEDVERSYLGVSLPRSGDRLEILDVVCASAADRAGVRVGDVLLEINGESAETFADLVDALADVTPGDEMTVTVRRGFSRLTLETTATAWPTEPPDVGCG